jgi:predicted enzyme related to lactoylglutathione lyase
MAKITGIGGVFFRTKSDSTIAGEFYTEKLGIEMEWPVGTTFATPEGKEKHEHGPVHWSIFAQDTKYFGDSDQQFMINYKVDNLDEYLLELSAKGVTIMPDRMNEEYGKFAWILDGDGYRIELWEPIEV